MLKLGEFPAHWDELVILAGRHSCSQDSRPPGDSDQQGGRHRDPHGRHRQREARWFIFALNARDKANCETPIYSFRLPTKSDSLGTLHSHSEQEREGWNPRWGEAGGVTFSSGWKCHQHIRIN